MTATDTLAAAVHTRCRSVLEANWRTGVRPDGRAYAYTAPSPDRYPWQWYWDSCFTALVWRRLDPARARLELESLLQASEADGFIGHTIFWGQPVDRVRRLFYNVTDRHAFMTRTIQPPLLPWIWSMAVGDPSAVPALVAHHEWFGRERDLDGDGLLWIIQPDETGLDASPMYDPVWPGRCCGEVGFPRLVSHNRRLGFDARRIAAAGGPVMCEPLLNTAHGLSRLALGQPSRTDALIDRLYDERSGLFGQWVRSGAPGRVARFEGPRPNLTWAALAPLALPDLPESIGRRMVEEHLLNGDEFRLPVGPPSVARDDPAFTLRDRRLGLRRYWRGPTWVNAAWFLWQGLRRLGYLGEAEAMARGLAEAVAREGLREYYDPFTGAGMGAVDFAWSTLILEMISPEG